MPDPQILHPNPIRDRRILTLRRRGMSQRAIAHEMGLSRAVVRRVIEKQRDARRRAGRASGVQRRQRNAERDPQIVTLRARGESLRTIASMLRCSKSTVHRVLAAAS